MYNEVNKTIQFWRLIFWYYWWKSFMRYTVEMASDAMLYTYISSFMKIGSGIHVMLKLLPQKFEWL
jgi:hypothetical protein